MKTKIETSGAPQAIGPYSQAIKANGFIFLSGQIPLDPESGQIVDGGIVAQTKRVMENIKAVLASENLVFLDIVKTTIFLTDLGDFAQLNEAYGSYFEADPPARSTVQVAALPKGAKVEIEAVAVLR